MMCDDIRLVASSIFIDDSASDSMRLTLAECHPRIQSSFCLPFFAPKLPFAACKEITRGYGCFTGNKTFDGSVPNSIQEPKL